MTQELHGVISLGGTVIGGSLNQRGLKGETGATGATGNGIASISKTGSSGLIDTYTITYTNGNTATFTVTNGQDGHSPIITASKSGKTTSVFLDGTKIAEIDDGVGIDSIYKTGSSGLDPVVDEYTILYDDGNYTTFTVTNGKKGDKGDPQSPYTSTPNMDGVGSAGSSSNYSRGDHVHPSDTTKVDKVAGKGLSENDFTDSLKTKLDGIASGAEVNVQSDWNQSTNTADDYIKNKPDLSVYAPLASPSLTGTPTAPTATEGTNTTQIATTAFVKTADDAVKGMLKDALPTDTASGAIASFPDGSDLFDCLSCVVDIDPIQDLHGYDKPWVGGAGKNLIPSLVPMLKAINVAGTWTDNAYFISGITFTVNDDGTITVNGTSNANIYFNYIQTSNPVAIKAGSYVLHKTDNADINLTVAKDGSFWNSTNTTDKTLNLATDSALSAYSYIASGKTISNFILKPMLELSTIATAWSPYENICPISGHDDVEVNVSGVNQWDEEWENGYYQANDGTKVSSNNYFRTKNPIRVQPSTSYYFVAPMRMELFEWGKNGGYLRRKTNNIQNAEFTTSADCYYVTFNTYVTATTYQNNISINYPSTDHDYHAYNGQTYTATLPSTTYGGTLDLVSGVLTVDMGYVDLGTITPTMAQVTQGNLFRFAVSGIKAGGYVESVPNIKCEAFPTVSNQSRANHTLSQPTGQQVVDIIDNDYSDAASFKTAMNGIHIAYELATPQTYQLTPQQIDTLKGQNNITATSGQVSVTYKADIQKYIDNAIATFA